MKLRMIAKVFILLMLISGCRTLKKRSAFEKIMIKTRDHCCLDVKDEDTGQIIEVDRVQLDQINDEVLKRVNNYLHEIESSYPDQTEYILIEYYPGKDLCNSTGAATRESIGQEFKELITELSKRKGVKLTGVYKNSDGIERWNKSILFHTDKDRLIEKTFFKYHYPCFSYLIIHKSGKYFAYFGENSRSEQVKDVDIFMEYINDTFAKI